MSCYLQGENYADFNKCPGCGKQLEQLCLQDGDSDYKVTKVYCVKCKYEKVVD